MADNAASRPQPVLYSQVVTVLTAVLGLLAAFGLPISDDQQEAILTAVTALVPIVALIAAMWARRKVTPLADPRDDLGRRLVPEQATHTDPPPPAVQGDGGAVIAPVGTGPAVPPATDPPRPQPASRRPKKAAAPDRDPT